MPILVFPGERFSFPAVEDEVIYDDVPCEDLDVEQDGTEMPLPAFPEPSSHFPSKSLFPLFQVPPSHFPAGITSAWFSRVHDPIFLFPVFQSPQSHFPF